MRLDARMLIPGLLALQVLFVGSTFRTTTEVLCVAMVCLALMFLRGRLDTTDHQNTNKTSKKRLGSVASFLILSLAIFVTIAWRLSTQLNDSFNPVAFLVDALAHAALFSALLTFTLHSRFGHPSMLGLGLFVVMLCIAAGGSSQSLAAQIAVALMTTSAFLVSSRYILTAWSQRSSEQQLASMSEFHELKSTRLSASGNRTDHGRVGLLFSGLAFSIIMMTTTAIAHVTNSILPDLRGALYDQLKSSFDSNAQDTLAVGSRYVHGNRLGAIRKLMLQNPNEEAFVVYSNVQPGYLRGTVFDEYSNGRWDTFENDLGRQKRESFEPRHIEPAGYGVTTLKSYSSGNLQRFNMHSTDKEEDKAIATLEVRNDPIKGQVFFSPLETRWVEGRGRWIRVTNHDILEHGIRVHFPYVLGVSTTPRVDYLEPFRRSLLTYVPPEVSTISTEISGNVCKGKQTARGKAAAISNYFGQHYSYSLRGTPVPPRTDPLAYFLDVKHPGHCEYFAAASVMLLRSVDVPARYVTGYVPTVYSTDDKRWVARNRDAHAWAEAYDESTKTWFAVESTPGRTYQNVAMNSGNINSDAETDKFEIASALGNDTWIGRAWGWLMSMRATDPLEIVFRVAQLPLFLFLVFMLWKRFFRGDDAIVSAEDVKSRRMLARVDKQLRKHELVRSPDETLHQFALRVESFGSELENRTLATPLLSKYASWYRDFAEARYRGQMPTPFV